MGHRTFDPAAFARLKKVEEHHFWFRVRRRWIFDRVHSLVPPPARFLEVGCGTGNISSFMAEKGYDTTGCEFYAEALYTAWPGFRRVQGDAARLPFRADSFDAVGLFDVIEHVDDDVTLIREAARVVRKGGIVAVTVPAREELWSAADVKAYHKRRYTKESLTACISSEGLEVLRMEYLFCSLYGPMKMIRQGQSGSNDQFAVGRLMNGLLGVVFDAERIISRVLPLRLGTSLMAFGRRLH